MEHTNFFHNNEHLILNTVNDNEYRELKFLAIGDSHFTMKNIEQSSEFTTRAIEFIDRHPEIDFIVLLGDQYDNFAHVHTQIMTNASKFFRALYTRKPLIIMSGNHDLVSCNNFLSDIHAYNDLKGVLGVHVVDKVLDITIRGFRLIFTPYVPPGRLLEALNTVPSPLTAHLIFAHQEIRGCKMGTIVSTKGDVWHPSYPFLISGHIHEYAFNGRNLLYPGTPFQTTFAESEDKTISLCTLTNRKLDENLYELKEERINLNLTKREVVRVLFSKLQLFNPNPLKVQKLVIIATEGEVKAFRKSDYYKSLSKLVAKIDYDYVTDAAEGASLEANNEDNEAQAYVQPKPYLVDLYEKIMPDPRSVKIFEQIFGSIDKSLLVAQ